MSFKDHVKQARTVAGWRQVDIARELSVSQVTVGDYERGKSYPELSRLEKLCNLLELDYAQMRALIAEEKRQRAITKAQNLAGTALAKTQLKGGQTASVTAQKTQPMPRAVPTAGSGATTDPPTDVGGTATQLKNSPELKVLDTPDEDLKNRTLSIRTLKTSIGRGRFPKSDIFIQGDQFVSRKHAVIVMTSEKGSQAKMYWIEDSGSTNGTWVNGAELKDRHCLQEGDKILVGDTTFEFHERSSKSDQQSPKSDTNDAASDADPNGEPESTDDSEKTALKPQH